MLGLKTLADEVEKQRRDSRSNACVSDGEPDSCICEADTVHNQDFLYP